MKKITLFTLIGLTALSLTHSPTLYAKDYKEVRIGTDPGAAPFEFKDKDGKLTGFDIELGNALCAQMKIKCTWVESDFDGLIPALKAKKFDVINASMSITEKRQKEIDFSDRITRVPSRMIAKANSKILPTAEALRGKRVGVQQASTHEAYAKQTWAKAGVEIVSYAKNDQIYADLQAGRLDAGLMDGVEANLGFLKTPNGKGFAYAGGAIVDAKIFGNGTGLGFRKEDAQLKDAMNQALKTLKSNGTYKTIMNKYFEFDVSGD